MALLSDRLRALGVRRGVRDLSPPRRRAAHSIEHVVSGRIEETTHGGVFLVEQRYPLELRHGKRCLELRASLHPIAEWACEPGLAQVKRTELVFLDTETTGLAGGTGTYAFMVGVARYDSDSYHLTQLFMRDPAEEPALLAALAQVLEPCQTLVTFNGRGFDVPLLTARFTANRFAASGISCPLHPQVHLDLLPLARWLWRDRLASRALGSLESNILGLFRTEEDVPGWMIPQMYFDYLRTGDARPLASVFYHNAMDILSLAALLNHIAELLGNPLYEDAHALDLLGMAKRLETLGQVDRAVYLYEQAIARNLPEGALQQTIERLSLIQKRQGNLLAAVQFWRGAAERGQLYACIELAKYYEHSQRDYPEAIRWTRTALGIVAQTGAGTPGCHQRRAELQHRLERLSRKLRPHSEVGPDGAMARG